MIAMGLDDLTVVVKNMYLSFNMGFFLVAKSQVKVIKAERL